MAVRGTGSKGGHAPKPLSEIMTKVRQIKNRYPRGLRGPQNFMTPLPIGHNHFLYIIMTANQTIKESTVLASMQIFISDHRVQLVCVKEQ